jgi:type IV pilus assembly protein PilB
MRPGLTPATSNKNAMPVFKLGEILVRKGYLTPEALQGALDKQVGLPPQTRLPMGQILLDTGLLSDAQLLECLEIQRKLAAMPAAPKPV